MIEKPVEKKKRRTKAQILNEKHEFEKTLAEAAEKLAALPKIKKPRAVKITAVKITEPVLAPVPMIAPSVDSCCGGCIGGCEPEVPTIWQKISKWWTGKA